MSGEASYDPAPFYVLNLKYVFEGILTPTIGLIGIIGIETAIYKIKVTKNLPQETLPLLLLHFARSSILRSLS